MASNEQRKKLTKTEADKAAPTVSRYCIWDTEIKGFGLRVQPSGSKSYVFLYRTPEGVKRWFTIGTHGNLTAEQARTKAKELAGGIATGKAHDPAGHKQARRQALTISELFDAYTASAKFAEHSTSTQVTTNCRINGHIKPSIGKVIADKLSKEDVRRLFADIRDGKTATDTKTEKKRGRSIITGGEGTARKVVRILRAVLNWGIEQGYLKENPAQGINIGTDGQRRAILDSQEQYKLVFTTIAAMETERRLPSHIADALRVIAFTGARRGEIANLKWSHVNLKKGLLILPADSHKTGKKTGLDREIGLPSVVQAIIAKQPERAPNDLVFPSETNGGPVDLSHYWTKVRDEAGLSKDIVLHSLRHSLASSLAFQGAQAPEIMAAMGHRHISTSQKYIHWTQDAKAALAERYTAGISAALNGNSEPPDVIDLNTRR